MVDFPLKGNDGKLSAFDMVRRKKQDYVLGLCAQNHCKAGRQGQIPGSGRIQIFINEGNNWSHEGTINLPENVAFEGIYGSIGSKWSHRRRLKKRFGCLDWSVSGWWLGFYRPGNGIRIPKKQKREYSLLYR